MTKACGNGNGGGGGGGYKLLEPIENLKAFASNRPPLVLFMICLGVIGLVLMTLAFYIKEAEIL